jgi:hypothetical protein
MNEKDRMSRNASRESELEADRGDLTPPHGDELRSEETFGRTDRYANQDDPDAESPVFEEKNLAASDDELNADARQRRLEQMDDRAADEARMATRKREHSAE